MPHPQQIALSIIVPCYKVEKYLPKCLDSLVSQTLKNIEIICINDGSPDRCIDILRSYEKKHPNKIVVIDKKNEGVWKGRWDAIQIAHGEYIGFLDSDDYAMPTFAESLYTAAKANSADIAVCGFDRIDLETGKRLSREMATEREPFSIAADPGRLVELNGAPWNKCFRADALKELYNLSNPPTVLDDLAFHLLAYQKIHGSVVFVPKSLVHYMVRSDSIINTVRDDQVASIFNAFLEIKGVYENSRPELVSALDGEVSRMTRFLDDNFPSWRKSPYINFRYAFSRGGALVKVFIVQLLYRAHLLPAFLAIYRFMVYKLHVDIKW